MADRDPAPDFDPGPDFDKVTAEMDAAETRYGPFTSTHEALGVLLEEVTELVGAIRANDLEAIRAEALQVAAVALRLAGCCRDDAAFARRSGAP